MGISFKSFFECVKAVTDQRLPILLRSRHGQGKSTVVYQFAKLIGLPVVERRASQMTEGDLLGLPKVDDGRTEWLPPDWLKTACDEKVVLFVDEIDRATMEVRQGFFELTDSRKVAGRHLHPDTLIFAAVNGGEHASQYQVGEMDPAELDRWVVFDLEPTVEDWLTWAKEVVNPVLVDFIATNHKHLEHNGDFEPNKVYPSRRSWERLSKIVSNGMIVAGEPSPVLFNLASSVVGFEAAIALQDYIANIAKQVTVEDIIVKGNLKLTEKWTINDHTTLVEKMGLESWFEKDYTDEMMHNLEEYVISMPQEIAAKLIKDFGTYGSKNHSGKAIPNFARLVQRAELRKIMVATLGGKSEETPAPKPATPAPTATKAAAKGSRVCSKCGKSGHNSRTCSKK